MINSEPEYSAGRHSYWQIISENIDTIPGLFQSAGSYSQGLVKADPVRSVHLSFLHSPDSLCTPASWSWHVVWVHGYVFGWDSHWHTLLKSQPRSQCSYPRMPLSQYNMHTFMLIQKKSSIKKYREVQFRVLVTPSLPMIRSFSPKNALQYVLKSKLWKIKTPLIKLVVNETKEKES